MNVKSIFASRTIWFNLILGVYNVLETAGLFQGLPQPWGVLIQTVGNLFLRGITTQPVSFSPAPAGGALKPPA